MANLRERFHNFVTFNENENNSVRHQRSSAETQNSSTNPRDTDNISYEDAHFRVYIQRTQHKRQSRFNIGDHLYLIKIQPKPNVDMPLLINIMDLLQTSLIHILRQVKSLYDSGNNLLTH